MKQFLITVLSTWLCATGVAVLTSNTISVSLPDSSSGRKQAKEIATQIAKRGLIPEYKPSTKYSSVVRKTVKTKITSKELSTNEATEQEIKVPIYVSNPIYAAFTNALDYQVAEMAEMVKNGDTLLRNGIVLAMQDGKPTFKIPEAYGRIKVGGVAIGSVLTDGDFELHTKDDETTREKVISEIVLSKSRHLDEPEFNCTDVTYSILPATRQVHAIRMHGDLSVKSEARACRMVREIRDWLREDCEAVDLHEDVPSDAIAYKKLRIGREMEVEVTVKWSARATAEKGNARIDIAVTTGELSDENLYECQELGQMTDAARSQELEATGVNYYTLRPLVTEDEVKSKVVY